MTAAPTPDVEQLVERVRDALEAGTLEPRQVEAMLASGSSGPRPAALQVLVGLGAVVAYLGLVLAYAVGFDDYPHWMQVATPFVFPATMFAAAAWMQRSGRAYWMRESVSLIAFASLVGATLASLLSATDSPDAASFTWASAGWAIIALVAGTQMRDLRVPWAAFSGAMIVVANAGAQWADIDDDLYRWVELGLAAAFAVGAALGLARGQRLLAEGLIGGSIVSSYVACVVTIGDTDIGETGLSPWHALLTVAVATALVFAPALRMPLLYAVGAAGALLWLTFVIPIATQSAAWALLVVAVGLGLVAVATVGTRLRGRHGR